MIEPKNWIDEVWNTELYQQLKRENFELVDKYLPSSPLKILDIGCGLAWESRMFSQKYGTELYLLDGDVSANKDKTLALARDTEYHASADNFLFYNKLETLNEQLFLLGTKNYHLIYCNSISIAEDIKFDVITSWLSCGFHYPLSTYRDLILKHSHEDTKIIVDIRIRRKQSNPVLEGGVEIIQLLYKHEKYVTAEIKFV